MEYLSEIDNNSLNEHWEREFQLCHPCHVHYDFVGRLEDGEDEANYMLGG